LAYTEEWDQTVSDRLTWIKWELSAPPALPRTGGESWASISSVRLSTSKACSSIEGNLSGLYLLDSEIRATSYTLISRAVYNDWIGTQALQAGTDKQPTISRFGRCRLEIHAPDNSTVRACGHLRRTPQLVRTWRVVREGGRLNALALTKRKALLKTTTRPPQTWRESSNSALIGRHNE
jgi:hypothetical protein